MTNQAAASFLALAEHSSRAMFSFDIVSNDFIYRNPAFSELVSLKQDLQVKTALESLIHPEDLQFVRKAYKELQRGSKRDRLEFRLLTPEKDIKTICLEAFIIPGEKGQKVVAGILEDVTAARNHNDILNKFSNKKNSILSNGLGMSIIKTIIEWHHGQIWFKSEENVGTTFYISLPAPK